MRGLSRLAAVGLPLMMSGIANAQSAVVPPDFSATPLIPRSALFGNPVKSNGRISPDGKWLSWTAPRDGVLNIYVAPVNAPDQARALTNERPRPIRQYFWAPDSRSLLFVQDKGGDENFLLYGVDVATGKQTALTPFTKTRAEVLAISSKHKDRILVSVNNRDAKWHDVHSLDLKSGKLSLVQRNDGYAGYIADDDLKLRMAMKSRADGGTDYYRVTGGKVEAKPFGSVGLEDSLTTSPAGFTADGKTLYWLDSRGRDTAAVLAQDVATGATTLVAENAKADIGSTLVNPKTLRIEAWRAEYLKPEWSSNNERIGATLKWLEAKLGGPVNVQSRTEADDKWVVVADKVIEPATVYLFDRTANSLTKLYTGRPDLVGAPLQPMWPVEIKARDGLTLVSYLTMPSYADPDRDGKPNAKAPLILLVHGGPWSRDNYGADPWHQWFANRGYSVLSVNYRASTGFGKKFISAGDLQWGKKMHDDLIDAVDWAIAGGYTSPDKVAIEGGSYGGYATLAALTMTPDKFACGSDVVGPSNLFTLLETIPPYWESFKQQFYQRMGDPTTEQGRAILKAASPLTYVDKINKPLLIGQGANDPRVNVRESDQIVAAMKAKGIPVTYVLFPDEGHGFSRPENNMAYSAVEESFFARCLGGRVEPIGDAIAKSSAKIPAGADYLPELKQAMAK